MKIGTKELTSGLFLAPMAGVTDAAFRRLCRARGADAVVTEMISSRAICFGDRRTKRLAALAEDERPALIQLFGNQPEQMAKAALALLDLKPDGIDLNMGCPAPKIVSNGDGSALMKEPQRVYDIVKAVAEAMKPFGIPVSVKMRAGWDAASVNAVPIAELCEKAGAAMLTVHGRTREQMYAPSADRGIIRDVKKAVSIPVIGNGDVTDAESAARMLEETGCDGLMIGRGALGNPYVFSEIAAYLVGKPYTKPSAGQMLSDIQRHMTDLCALKGEEVGHLEARKHLAWYLRGVRGAAAYRDAINRAASWEEEFAIVRTALLCHQNISETES